MDMENKVNQIDVNFLQAFSDAWNNHDIDALMTFMADDCVFHTAGGNGELGGSFQGKESVRESFVAVWTNFPDVAWKDPMHFVCGDRAVSESTFTATNPDGSRIEARMVDVFTLKGGKILVKNAYRKNRPAIQPS
ncbi:MULTISPECIES: nuclear transport factor 2 family protein [Vibrio]|uniref:Nuclear transport factor 2 family protein n=1 Tax=Vibrio casei TaxID=673372 RepID=A0A368LIL1_9VIBR|nr:MULTISPECIES: nuclear transport factor 2 family protein [Vibrio]RCS70574.1 nuclear transport factor 2 family protein [Vibrio casei]SJN27476.1 Ketosteroid isomerase-related protein [Vibrio casei]HBV77822.1 nuclear transport factor 2 family protein [Vibrio sp.]